VTTDASASDSRPNVLLTGAAGKVGTGFRNEYVAHYEQTYRLTLADRKASLRDDRFENVLTFDIEDFQATKDALQGAEVVIHLAANPDPEASFKDLVGPNVVGIYNVLEAARQAQCRRVVFASSVHAILGYPIQYQVTGNEPARPDCAYGATKVFGEGLCAVFADQLGLSCIAIRIGAYAPAGELESMVEADPEAAAMVITQRDLAQLIHRCVVAPPELKYAILHGASNNRYNRMDIGPARESVGYRPIDDAFGIPSSSAT
jgi:UDP-glucose 4-epimerase